MNLHEVESDASGSDAEIVPLDFRTAIVKEGTAEKLVIQAKPISYNTIEEEMDGIQKGRLRERLEARMDPDNAMGSVDDYLASVRKEAFNNDDQDVVLIDPGLNTKKLYEEVNLPCNQEKRINNAIDAPLLKGEKTASVKAQKKGKENVAEKDNTVKSLKDAQAKAAIIHQRHKQERLNKMKEFGLISQDANEEEADILGAPMMIPFAGTQVQPAPV